MCAVCPTGRRDDEDDCRRISLILIVREPWNRDFLHYYFNAADGKAEPWVASQFIVDPLYSTRVCPLRG